MPVPITTLSLVLTGSEPFATSQAQLLAPSRDTPHTTTRIAQISPIFWGRRPPQAPAAGSTETRLEARHRRRSTVVFSSPIFLFVFLPALLGLYYLIGPRLRNLLLLVASLLFYIWGEGTYVFVMIAIIAINYALGRRIGSIRAGWRCQAAVTLAVAVNLGLLIVFKYSNFLVDQLNLVLAILRVPPIRLNHVHLPLGISFFTFHALSYVIDVSRRAVRSARPLDFALYMTFFPHSIAGPIVRYGDIAGQLAERIVTTAEFAAGVRRFIIGLAKKMLVANTVAVTANAIFALPQPRFDLQPRLARSRLLHAADLL